jgi:hypothetical protein
VFCSKSNLNNYHNKNKEKFSVFSKLYIYFCKRKNVLNVKIINFFFDIVYLSVQNSDFLRFQVLKGSKFYLNYKILFIFLKFNYFIIEFINNNFKMNSEKFFSNIKDVAEYLIFYKSFLYTIFLNIKNPYYNLFSKFSFTLHLNYLLYSIFFFMQLFLKKIQNFELNKKRSRPVILELPLIGNVSKSHLFYKNKVYLMGNLNNNKQLSVVKEDIPLYLFCSNRVNFKTLNDSQFSIFLNHIRYAYRNQNINMNSFKILNLIVKKAIPLSKIVYQRRGRNLIPLMTFIYSQEIRNSLGIKLILGNKNKVKILDSNSFETQLLVSILDLLISSNKNNFIYQSDKDSSVRKEAYSKGYFLKTLKSNFSKWN